MAAFQKILCPVDFSDYSKAALRHAAEMSRARDFLIVMTVNDPLLVMAAEKRFKNAAVGGTTPPQLQEFANRTLAGLVRRPRVRCLVIAGSPGQDIVKTAKRLRADVIVMGTRGFGGVRRLMIGSTTDYVLRHAATPVLALPAAWTMSRARSARMRAA